MRQGTLINHKRTNFFHTVLLFAGMVILLATLGQVLGGVKGLLWAIVLSIPLLLLGQRISPRLVLRMYGARPLSAHDVPDLYQMVQELAHRAGLPVMPKLHYVPSQVMNAFSVGSREDPVIGLTDGLLRRLSRRELTGVLAHELTHIRHNDMRVIAFADLIGRLTGLFSTLGKFLLFVNLPLLLMGAVPISWVAVVLLIVAPMLSGLLQLALARSREVEADLGAAELTHDPAGLASALRKMACYETNARGQVLIPGYRTPDPSLFRTHPQTEDRVRRLFELAGLARSHGAEELFSCSDGISRISRQSRWDTTGLWH
jgi:heat shock protein HtpX